MDSSCFSQRFINIVQWNARSIKPKQTEFECMLFQHKVHIAIISETWLNEDININIRDYSWYRKDRDDSYGGVGILAHRSIRVQVCPLNLTNSGIEVIAVKVLNCQFISQVICVYCPSSVYTSQADWDELFSKFSSKTLIAGDFNGHHRNWSYKNDTRGFQLLDSSLEHGYIYMNDGSITRTEYVNNLLQKSSPDITFASSDIVIHFSWTVLNENLSSDHFILKICTNFQDRSHFIKKRNYKKADWTLYANCVVDSINCSYPHSSEYTIQKRYDTFVDIIKQAADSSIPWLKINTDPQTKFTPKPYWNAELSKLVAQRRFALSTFRRNPTPNNLLALENRNKIVKTELSKAKSNNWREFCNSTNESTSLSDMWRRMRWIKGYRKNRFEAPADKKHELLCNLAPDFVKISKPSFASSNHLLEQTFSLQELEVCLKKKDSAPGEDDITYSMIYNLPLIGRNILITLYNDILISGLIPQQWRDIKIVPIPKVGSSDPLEVKLRPISLISCLCKILHLMLAKRLEWFIERNKILSPYTTGFRKAQSCLDSVTRLVSTIQAGFTKNIPTLACYLDLENAYNNVLVDKLVMTLDSMNVGSTICNYLWEYLSERHLKIIDVFDDTDNSILVRWTSKGLAQGDPISPLLFNIITYEINSSVSSQIAQYADDFVIFTSDKKVENCISSIQNSLDIIVQILIEIGLDISAHKSKFCLYSRGHRKHQIQLNVNNSPLSCEANIRYLGMWLDRSLRWGRHINEVSEKTQKFLNILKVLAGSGWGIHPKHLRRLYINLIRSRIDFGSYLYDNSAKCHTYKIDKIQNQALRIIGGFIKTTPIHVMESEICIPPLAVRRQYLAFKFCLKAKSWTNGITTNSLKSLNALGGNIYWSNKKKPLLISTFNLIDKEKITSSNPLEMFSLKSWLSKINIKYIVRDSLDCVQLAKKDYDQNLLKNDILCELDQKYRNWFKIFTDGSKSTGASGAAFYDSYYKRGECYRNTSNVSIMSLELFAISEALTYLKYNVDSHLDIVIYSDSKSALQHITSCVLGNRGTGIAYDVLRKIEDFSESNITVVLQWIPSHIGLSGNEEADRLARAASSDGTETFILESHSELTAKYRRLCNTFWREYFDERSKTKGIWYKIIQSQPPSSPWFMGDISRGDVVAAHRLRSGHMPLRKFAYLMGKVTSPNCETCDKPEDVYHVLVECVRNQAERQLVLQELNINVVDVGAFHQILAYPNTREARLLFDLANCAGSSGNLAS